MMSSGNPLPEGHKVQGEQHGESHQRECSQERVLPREGVLPGEGAPPRRGAPWRGVPSGKPGVLGQRAPPSVPPPPSVQRTRRLDCRGGGTVSTVRPAKSLDVSLPSGASVWACLITPWSSRRPGATPPTHPVNRETEPWGRAWPGLQTGGNSWGQTPGWALLGSRAGPAPEEGDAGLRFSGGERVGHGPQCLGGPGSPGPPLPPRQDPGWHMCEHTPHTPARRSPS